MKPGPKPKPVAERFWSKVVKTDACWEWVGSTVNGYGSIHDDGRTAIAHRLSYEWAHGAIPEGMLVDHTCHNRRCVNPDHLRLATPKQNEENRTGAASNSQTGIRGVWFDPHTGKYGAQVGHEGRKYWCGRHATIEEAEAAAIAKRNELFTHNDSDRQAVSA